MPTGGGASPDRGSTSWGPWGHEWYSRRFNAFALAATSSAGPPPLVHRGTRGGRRYRRPSSFRVCRRSSSARARGPESHWRRPARVRPSTRVDTSVAASRPARLPGAPPVERRGWGGPSSAPGTAREGRRPPDPRRGPRPPPPRPPLATPRAWLARSPSTQRKRYKFLVRRGVRAEASV